MTNTINTDALNEFVAKRCEEILSRDEYYMRLNDVILKKESAFKKSLTPEQRKEYNKIEEEIIKSIAHAAKIVYINCLNDIEFSV